MATLRERNALSSINVIIDKIKNFRAIPITNTAEKLRALNELNRLNSEANSLLRNLSIMDRNMISVKLKTLYGIAKNRTTTAIAGRLIDTNPAVSNRPAIAEVDDSIMSTRPMTKPLINSDSNGGKEVVNLGDLEEENFFQKNKMILIGVGVIAIIGGAYYFMRKK
jgi:hypothetical protein